MDFSIPDETERLLEELDEFIASEIEPLEEEHPEFFDHRREYHRTNWEDGTPSEAWDELLAEQRRRSDEAGFYRLLLPESVGGQDLDNLSMAVVRERLARKGPGLHNVLTHEASVVGNFSVARILERYGSAAQKDRYLEAMVRGELAGAFGLTEPDHGSDATYMETTARRSGDEWVINGEKRFISGMHRADVCLLFARSSGDHGDHRGITSFLVPTDAEGFEVPYYHWSFNMPTDHAEVVLNDVRIPGDAVVGEEGAGLRQAQDFVHEGRIRQSAASLGAGQFCIDESVDYANRRQTWGTTLSRRQAIQFPLAELHTEAELIRNLVRKTAWELDQQDQLAISDKVSMGNYRANRLACDAADRAIQVHGGIGYMRGKPFEHIYRHHRRYRITEGSEEIQIRNVAGHLFGFIG